MPSVPINRAWALIICTRPQDYAPPRVRETPQLVLGLADGKKLANVALGTCSAARERRKSAQIMATVMGD